jgi:hypothetical protein
MFIYDAAMKYVVRPKFSPYPSCRMRKWHRFRRADRNAKGTQPLGIGGGDRLQLEQTTAATRGGWRAAAAAGLFQGSDTESLPRSTLRGSDRVIPA